METQERNQPLVNQQTNKQCGKPTMLQTSQQANKSTLWQTNTPTKELQTMWQTKQQTNPVASQPTKDTTHHVANLQINQAAQQPTNQSHVKASETNHLSGPLS